MEFNFYLGQLFKSDEEGLAIISGDSVPKSINSQLTTVLDNIGVASAKAQGLKATITTGIKFIGSDQRIYIKVEGKKCIGFLKVGVKKLFIRDESGNIKEISPLCVLDFYVHESQQRSGHGKALFTKMLEYEKAEPRKLGYDRPSEKLLSFLEKHYHLSQYVPQNNNFVVFKDYFDTRSKNTNAYTTNKNSINTNALSKNTPYHINSITNTNIISNNKNKNFDIYEGGNNYELNTGYKGDIYQKKKMEGICNKFTQKTNEVTKSANKATKKDFFVDDKSERDLVDHFAKININSDLPVEDNTRFNKKIKQSDNKYSYDFDYDFSNKHRLNNNPPWATNGSSSNFISSSSSYGAYYALKK